MAAMEILKALQPLAVASGGWRLPKAGGGRDTDGQVRLKGIW
jgi:hypothetical protein